MSLPWMGSAPGTAHHRRQVDGLLRGKQVADELFAPGGIFPKAGPINS